MRRGAMLLEVMVALAILLMASMTLAAIVMQSVAAMSDASKTMQACDLARSVMAQIEAGMLDPTAVNGPVVRWDASMLLPPEGAATEVGLEEAADVRGDVSAEVPVAQTSLSSPEWSVRVETEPTQYAGLFLVTVTATQSTPGAELVTASYTLRQVVRLGLAPEDVAGEEDELMDAARRGLRGGGR